MNERLTLQDLIDLLGKKQDISKKDAETFLRELVSVISDSIEQNETVKIKDFGTFKLVKVSARKSVDVNTGEDIEIAAHYKLSFVPDKVIKDAVNRPFAHFETVLLEEGVTFDNALKADILPEDEDEETDDEVDTKTEAQTPIELPQIEQEIRAEEPNEKEQIKQNILAAMQAQPDEQQPEEEQASEEPINEDPAAEAPQSASEQAIEEEEEVVNIPPQVFNEAVLPIEKEETKEEMIADLEPLEVAHPEVKTQATEKKVPESEPDLVLEPTPRYIKRRAAYDEDEDFEDEAVDYSAPKRNYYVMGLIAVAVIAVAFVIYRYLPYIQSVLEPDGVYYDPNGTYNAGDPLPEDTLLMDGAIAPLEKEGARTDISAKTEDKKEEAPKAEDKKPEPKPTADSKPSKKEYLADVTLGKGSNLRQIALDNYGNKIFWVYIYEENKAKIANPNNIAAGTKLKIPALKNFGLDPKNPKDIEKAEIKQRELYKQFP